MLFCASVQPSCFTPCSFLCTDSGDFNLLKLKIRFDCKFSDHHCTSVYHRRSFPHRDDNDHDYRAERGGVDGTLDSHLVISLPCLHDCVVYDDDEAVRGDECCWYFWPTQLAHSRRHHHHRRCRLAKNKNICLLLSQKGLLYQRASAGQ